MDYVERTGKEYKDAYPWVDQVAIEVSHTIHACAAATRNASTDLSAAVGMGRTAGRFSVLRVLSLSPDGCLTQKQIASRLLITWAPVTALVDGLEKNGLVERVTNQRDRRSTIVHLTQKGRDVCELAVPAMARLSSEFCVGFTDAEKATLLSLLRRFWHNAMADPVAGVFEGGGPGGK
jgi:DNA-binding MarR family transcriptional regulator